MSAERKFQPGDVVMLDSGSPNLNVIVHVGGTPLVAVEWFGFVRNGTKWKMSAIFHERILKKVSQ